MPTLPSRSNERCRYGSASADRPPNKRALPAKYGAVTFVAAQAPWPVGTQPRFVVLTPAQQDVPAPHVSLRVLRVHRNRPLGEADRAVEIGRISRRDRTEPVRPCKTGESGSVLRIATYGSFEELERLFDRAFAQLVEQDARARKRFFRLERSGMCGGPRWRRHTERVHGTASQLFLNCEKLVNRAICALRRGHARCCRFRETHCHTQGAVAPFNLARHDPATPEQ